MPAPRLAPDEEIDGSRSDAPAFSRGPAKRPAAPPLPPETAEEAEARYFRRYGWGLVLALLGPMPVPETPAQWIRLAHATRDYLTLPKAEQLARRLEDLAVAIRRQAE